MNLNATLFIQCLVFFALSWFTARFVWPPVAKILDERAQKIAQGLADSEKARFFLSDAQEKADQSLKKVSEVVREKTFEAEKRASEILAQAHSEAQDIVLQAKKKAGEASVQAKERAKEELMKDFSGLVWEATRAILQREVDMHVHHDVLENMRQNWLSHGE